MVGVLAEFELFETFILETSCTVCKLGYMNGLQLGLLECRLTKRHLRPRRSPPLSLFEQAGANLRRRPYTSANVHTTQLVTVKNSRPPLWAKPGPFVPGNNGAPSDEPYPLRSFFFAQEGRSTISTWESADKYGFASALRRRDGDHILSALVDASTDHDFIESIPKTTWTEILRLLDPQCWSPPLHRIHRTLNPTKLKQIGFDFDENKVEIMRRLQTVIAIRGERHITTDLVDYRILLSYAAQTGNAAAARALWTDMQRDEVSPDVACYNRYMEALVWDEEGRLPQAKRAKDTFPRVRPRHAGYITLFEPGVSREIQDLFSKMAVDQVSGNVSTFCVLMTALARDGDIQAVYSILRQVWGIDAKAMDSGVEAPLTSVKYTPTSALYPSSRLLATVADIFGSHNNIPLAVQLVDSISRRFDIPIKSNVWYRLLQWTWLQARVKHSERLRPSSTPVNLHTVQLLYRTMLAEPYNVKDSFIDMHHLNFKTTQNYFTFRLGLGLNAMKAGRTRYIKSQKAFRTAKHRYVTASHSLPGQIRTHSLAQLSRRLYMAKVKEMCHHLFLQRWTRNILSRYLPEVWTLSKRISKDMQEWQLRRLPDFLMQWKTFVPQKIRYQAPTGLIELLFRAEEEVEAARKRKAVAGLRVQWIWLDRKNVQVPLWDVGKPWKGRKRYKRKAWTRSAGTAAF